MNSLYINPWMTIPANELSFTAARSSGPGGQNVNKVNSKVILKWNPGQSASFEEGWHRRLIARYGNRINKAGELLIPSERYRDQARNLADARQKLVDLLLACQSPPVKRRPTLRTKASQIRRLNEKRIHKQKKQSRRANWRRDG